MKDVRNDLGQATEALQKLVELKHWKDEHGKDEHYEECKPKAWEKAENVLSVLNNFIQVQKDLNKW